MDVWECISKFELVVFFKGHWQEIKDFGNSNFTTALLGSLAGAFAGALGAHTIAEKAKYKEHLITEMKLTNSATAVTTGIVSSLFDLKGQHLLPMKTEYDKGKLAFTEAPTNQRKQQKELVFLCDFRALAPQSCSVDVLQSYIHGKLVMKSRPLALIGAIAEAVDGLKFTTLLRNNLINDFKTQADKDFNAHPIEVYFGLPLPSIGQDTRYGDLLNAMYSKTDDAIYFCMLLIKDLNEHCKNTLDKYQAKFGEGEIEPNVATFNIPASRGLMPDETKYTNWITNFQSRPKKLSRLQRFMNRINVELHKKRSFKLW